MVTVFDLKAEFAELAMFRGRSPATTAAEKKGAIVRLAPFRDGAIFASKFAGTTDWERHPQGDEIVQIVEGTTTLHLITPEGRQYLTLSKGMLTVVPRGAWHRFEAPGGVCVLTATPQPSEHFALGEPPAP